MTSTTLSTEERRAADGGTRLLAGLGADGGAVGLEGHRRRWGDLDLRRSGRGVLAAVEESGLSGHGGAAFPVAAKWRSVAAAGRPVVVANGAEGEPASAKDATLLARTPHLVLDGAQAAAAALGAEHIVVYTPTRFVPGLQRAVAERADRGLDRFGVEVFPAAGAFLAGQESAVVNALNGRDHATPIFQGVTPVRIRGVVGRPTLVHNVETLAHVALIARFGPEWFRGVGTRAEPGTTLVTVTGRYRGPVVVEAPYGTPFAELLGLSRGEADRYRAALLGGYGGAWVGMDVLADLDLLESSARRHGATLGPGVVVLLDRSVCPLAEVARVVRYMHGQAAGQCGPCVHGLSGLDRATEALARRPGALHGRTDPIEELCRLVDGRGACRHPDGVARFVSSALRVFRDEVATHLRRGPCALVNQPGVLPLGAPRPARSRARRSRRR